jgi:hypothetical protein
MGSTPIIHLWEYRDLIYFGDTAKEQERAIEEALHQHSKAPSAPPESKSRESIREEFGGVTEPSFGGSRIPMMVTLFARNVPDGCHCWFSLRLLTST